MSKRLLASLTNWKLHPSGKTSIKGLLITKLRMQSTFSTFFSPLFGYLMLIAFFALSTSFTSVAVFISEVFCLISHTRSSRRKLTSTIRDKWEKSLNLKRRQFSGAGHLFECSGWLFLTFQRFSTLCAFFYILCSFLHQAWPDCVENIFLASRKPFRRFSSSSKALPRLSHITPHIWGKKVRLHCVREQFSSWLSTPEKRRKAACSKAEKLNIKIFNLHHDGNDTKSVCSNWGWFLDFLILSGVCRVWKRENP